MSLKKHIKDRIEAFRQDNEVLAARIRANNAIMEELSRLLAVEDSTTEGDAVRNISPVREQRVIELKTSRNGHDRLKPADAVRNYVSNFSTGVAIKKLVSELVNEIETDSTDRKRLLYNTVFNLKKRGTLVPFKDEHGREGVRLAEGQKENQGTE